MDDIETTEFVGCPVCGGMDVEGGRTEIDDSYAHQEVECENCGSYWKECYQPHSYADIVVGDGYQENPDDYIYPELGERLDNYQPGLEYLRDDGKWVPSGVIRATMSKSFLGRYRKKKVTDE